VHHPTTITRRGGCPAGLGAGPPLQPTLVGLHRPGARPLLQRFWATMDQRHETAYLILFIKGAPEERAAGDFILAKPVTQQALRACLARILRPLGRTMD